MGGRSIGRAGAVLLAVLTLAQALPPAVPAAPPSSGRWYIDGDEVLENGTFCLNDDVQVNASGSLTVRDARLVSNASYIRILVFGRLVLDNTSMVRGDPGLYPTSMVIDSGSTADLRHCSFDDMWFDVQFGDARFTSCNFTGPDCYINQRTYGAPNRALVVDNCTFLGRSYTCIMSGDSGLTVTGSRFFSDESWVMDSATTESIAEAPEEGTRIRDNLFIGLGTGILLESSHYYYRRCAISVDSSGQTPLLVRNNTIAGFDYGVDVAGDHLTFELAGNRLQNCTTGIDVAYLNSPLPDSVVWGNVIEGGKYGVLPSYGSLTIRNNTVSNCTDSGFYSGYSSASVQGPSIRGNTVTGCPYGAWLSNTFCELSSNNFSDCRMAGIYVDVYSFTAYEAAILDNTIAFCGYYSKPAPITPAGITATAAYNGQIRVSGNILRDCPAFGIRADGKVLVDNNTVDGAAIGIWCRSLPEVQQEVRQNRVSGGQVGIWHRGAYDIVENDISDVRTGILSGMEGSSSELRIRSNAIHAIERGIELRNPSLAARTACVTGNVIAAGLDGVLVDSVEARIAQSDFGGTRGVCVHAIGREPSLADNDFGSTCAGRVLQEWYLAVRAFESPDPYNSIQWAPTDRYTARVVNDTGQVAFLGESGSSTSLDLNLTGYTVDPLGARTNFTRYSVTVMKPRVGVGWAPATLVENAVASIHLFPRADLAVQDIRLPGGRPLPGQTVTVDVSVVHDTTYDTFFTYLGAVTVALRDNGLPIGEKQIARLEPNATAVLRFGWSVYGGQHTLTAIVDPDARIAEAFEDNNVFTREVSVNEVPVPVLSVSDTNPAAGRTVAFSSAGSTDDTGVVRSLFDFGDGTDSGWTADSTVLHVFPGPGIYECRLRVADAEGARSDWSLTEYVTVTEGSLQAALVANSTVFDTLVPVLLSASPVGAVGAQYSFAWDFGDGSSELGWSATQEHVFARAGEYTARVTVTDPLGLRGSATVRLTARNRPPVAALDFSPAGPTVLSPVRFSSGSGDPDGVVAGWRWDLGDGNRSTDPAPRHLYLEKGDFTVTLEVQDDSGAWSAPAARRLTVRNIPPSARASPSAVTVHAGDPVLLDAGLTVDPDDGFGMLTFRWASPDGWSADGPNASRRYDAPGRYRISLTVTDGSGASSQDTVTVEVLPAGAAGGPPYRELSLALSVSAVAVFLAAFFVYGRDRNGPARRTPQSNSSVKRGWGKNNEQPIGPPNSSGNGREE